MTMSMRVMSVGAAYRYLLKSVAIGDGSRDMTAPLIRGSQRSTSSRDSQSMSISRSCISEQARIGCSVSAGHSIGHHLLITSPTPGRYRSAQLIR